MSDIVTDLSINKNWNVAIGFNNTFTFTFVDSNSAAFDISGYTYSLQIRRFLSDTNTVGLTEASGLTNGGATGILTAVLNSANSSLLNSEDYFWQLTVVHPDTFTYRWYNGTLRARKQLYTGDTASGVTTAISINGTAITSTLQVPGGITLSLLATTLQTALADTPLDADTFNFYDAVDAVLKKVTWTNLKTLLQSVFRLISNTENALTSGSTVDIDAYNNTLATALSAITFTVSVTGDFWIMTVTLSAASSTFTFPANSLCVIDGTASGDNTMALSGTSGDVYEIMGKKRGATYTIVGKNCGQ